MFLDGSMLYLGIYYHCHEHMNGKTHEIILFVYNQQENISNSLSVNASGGGGHDRK